MSKFLVVCEHASIEVVAETAIEARNQCRCRWCKRADKTANELTYIYKDVRVYRADVNLMEA